MKQDRLHSCYEYMYSYGKILGKYVRNNHKTYHGVISSGREYNSMQNQSVQSSLVPGLPGNLLRRLVDGGLYVERDHLIK